MAIITDQVVGKVDGVMPNLGVRIPIIILLFLFFVALTTPYLQSYILPRAFTPVMRGLVGACYIAFLAAYAFSYKGLDFGFGGSPKVNRLLLFWVAISFVSVCISDVFYTSLVRQVEWLSWLLFAFAVTVVSLKSEKFQYLTLLFVPVGLAFCTLVIVAKWCTLDDPHNFRWTGATEIFSHIRHLSIYAMGAFVASLLPFFSNVLSRRVSIITLVLGVYALAVIFWTGGRGAFVGVVAASLLALVFSAWNKKLLLFLVVAFLLALLFSETFWVKGQSFALFTSEIGRSVNQGDFSSGRYALWLDVLRNMDGNWLFGMGPDGYRFSPKILQDTVQPHNAYIQFVVEWGLVGGGAFMAFLALVVSRGVYLAYLDRHEGKYGAPVVGLLILCSMGVVGLVDGSFYQALPQMLIALAIGLVFVMNGQGVSAPLKINRNHSCLILTILVIPIILHLAVIKVQWKSITPAPNSAQIMELIKLFPSDVARITWWLRDWRAQGLVDEEQYLTWLQWLQQYSDKSWKYKSVESGQLRRMGRAEEANEVFARALLIVPNSEKYLRQAYRAAGVEYPPAG